MQTNGKMPARSPQHAADLLERFTDRTAVVGVLGLGYVGLPLAVEAARSGYRVLGFDIAAPVVEGITRGESHVQDVSSEVLRAFVGEGLISATTDLTRLTECDAAAHRSADVARVG